MYGRPLEAMGFGMDMQNLPFRNNPFLAQQFSSMPLNDQLMICDPKLSAQEKSPDSGVAADADTDVDSPSPLESDQSKSLAKVFYDWCFPDLIRPKRYFKDASCHFFNIEVFDAFYVVQVLGKLLVVNLITSISDPFYLLCLLIY